MATSESIQFEAKVIKALPNAQFLVETGHWQDIDAIGDVPHAVEFLDPLFDIAAFEWLRDFSVERDVSAFNTCAHIVEDGEG